MTNSLWTLACVVIGPLTSYGQEQRYMIHGAELNLNVKNNEKCPLQPPARLLCCISSPICGNVPVLTHFSSQSALCFWRIGRKYVSLG